MTTPPAPQTVLWTEEHMIAKAEAIAAHWRKSIGSENVFELSRQILRLLRELKDAKLASTAPQTVQPLWSDRRIRDEANRYWRQTTVNAAVRLMTEMRDEYEIDRAAASARIAELTRNLSIADALVEGQVDAIATLEAELAELKRQRYEELLRREFGDRSDE